MSSSATRRIGVDMPKYIFERTSLVTETFTVVADSEDEALDLVRDGGPTVKVGPMQWQDWYDEEYSLDSVEDELVTFLNSKNQEATWASSM
jgi:tagatose-1,6-bisphosphate aldolase non-catalytic subunit AgaZ/GatZ